MRIIRTLNHLGYGVTIYGEYKQRYSIEFEGNTYFGGVELTYRIMKDDKLIDFKDIEGLCEEALLSKIDPRAIIAGRQYIYKGKIFKKTIGITKLEDELSHSLELLIDHIKTKINQLNVDSNIKEYEKHITDGLPDSLKNLN